MIERIETRYGTMFIPDTDNGQYWWLKNIGASPEDEYIEMVCAILAQRPRGTVLDVGANFGCWTLPLSKVAERVYAFEPQRCVLALLQRTIAANQAASNAEAWPYAVGEWEGLIKVQTSIRTSRRTSAGSRSACRTANTPTRR